MTDRFEEQLKGERLLERYRAHRFTQEELEYIELQKFKFPNGSQKSAIETILYREKIIEYFGPELERFKEILEREVSKIPGSEESARQYMQLLSDKPFGDNVHEELEKQLEKQTTYYFNDRINCGGYALRIDRCIFPTGNHTFGATISSLLEQFPFIRLLGNTQLDKDEYLVLYRAGTNGEGHHFIRIDSDGIVREKDGPGEPRVFEHWADSLEECEQAIFAVKKDCEKR